jgi:membrane associated rhomboid family serine protease
VFPLRDENPTATVPIVTLLLVGVTVAVWWTVQGAGFSYETMAASICRYGAIPAEVTGAPARPDGPCALGGFTWEAVLTSMFVHGGWAHLIGNMWFLWIFGNNVEDALGHVRFLVFYVVAGAVAGLAQVLSTPTDLSPMVGASGAVSAVMGGYLLLFPRARVHTLFFFVLFVRVIPIPAWLMLGYWMGLQLLASSLDPSDGGGVAYMAHIGGFAAGLVLLLALRPFGRFARGGASRGPSSAGGA